jgi:hypothetical protein
MATDRIFENSKRRVLPFAVPLVFLFISGCGGQNNGPASNNPNSPFARGNLTPPAVEIVQAQRGSLFTSVPNGRPGKLLPS